MWPTPQDYNEAVQNPGQCFAEPELMTCRPELNALGLPRAISGAFASVYQLRNSSKQWAVRCFLRNVPDLAIRYAKISEGLSAANLKYTVPFEFISKGLLVGGTWYPILKMEWVTGESLATSLSKGKDNQEHLSTMLAEFRRLCAVLQQHGIAHGDFQHGNIIVQAKQLRLVDYDGMFVPALEGFASQELGHRHYQHPQRSGKHFGPYLDNFAAWSIYTSLYCLMQDSRLWSRLDAGDECLLFRHEDYLYPTESIAFRHLENHDSKVIREASKTLRAILSIHPEDIPPLGEAIAKRDQLPILEPPPLWLPNYSSTSDSFRTQAERSLRTAHNDSLLVAETPPILRVFDEKTDDQAWYQTMPEEVQIPIRHMESRQANTPRKPPTGLRPPSRNKKRKRFLGGYGPLAATWSVLLIMILINAGQIPQSANTLPAKSSKLNVYRPKRIPLPEVPNNLPGAREIKFAAVPAATSFFEQGQRLLLAKQYFDALQSFSLARHISGTTLMERTQCTYQIGRCRMKMGEYQLALSEFDQAEEAFKDLRKFVPSLGVDQGEALLQLRKYNRAARVFRDQIDQCNEYGLRPSYSAPAISGLRRAALELLANKDHSGFAAYGKYLDEAYAGTAQTYADLRNVANRLEEKHDADFAFMVRKVSLEMLDNRPVTTPKAPELKSYKLETMQAMLKNRQQAGDRDAVGKIEQDMNELRKELRSRVL